MEAHELLCSHAPQFLRKAARGAWQQDAAAFSGWLEAFDETCRAGSLLSPSRLPHELIPLLEADSAQRPPLLLAGFDRILPVQRSFSTPGASGARLPAASLPKKSISTPPKTPRPNWRPARSGAAANSPPTPAPACWSLLRRPARAAARSSAPFLRTRAAAAFEFSLGVPLSQVALARAAHLLLRWLDGPLDEQELDWLLSTGLAAANAQESAALQSYMRTLRRHGLERPQWTLAAFLGQRCASELLPASGSSA